MLVYKSKKIPIKHLFTCKDGGVSSGNYKSLNLAFHVGDKKEDVEKNHKILADFLGYDIKNLIFMNQIHSNKVQIVSKPLLSPPSCDALVTNQKGLALMVMSADCSPVIFYDKAKEVVAVAHIGRKGAFENIIKNVLDVMSESFTCKSEDIVVSIGPNIKKCCYEIGQNEIDEAKKLGYNFAVLKNKLDIDGIILKQLKSCKIKSENIEFLPFCTKCSSDIFFSYRKEKVTGRNCAVTVL